MNPEKLEEEVSPWGPPPTPSCLLLVNKEGALLHYMLPVFYALITQASNHPV